MLKNSCQMELVSIAMVIHNHNHHFKQVMTKVKSVDQIYAMIGRSLSSMELVWIVFHMRGQMVN